RAEARRLEQYPGGVDERGEFRLQTRTKRNVFERTHMPGNPPARGFQWRRAGGDPLHRSICVAAAKLRLPFGFAVDRVCPFGQDARSVLWMKRRQPALVTWLT